MDSQALLRLLFEISYNLLRALEFCIFIAVILSWFPNAQRHPVALFFRRIAEPVLALARMITPRMGMIDLSPIVALLGIMILQALLRGLAVSLGIIEVGGV